MSIPSDLSHLLRMFSIRKDSPQVPLPAFKDYIQRYAKHYLQQKPELVVYLEISQELLLEELKKLQIEHKVEIIADKSDSYTIFIPYFFIDKINKRYKEIETKPEIPFPLISELPKNFPVSLLKKMAVSDAFASLEVNQDGKNFLYSLDYSGDIPNLIFPGTYTAGKILNLALAKIRQFLIKDESRDYMQKRLMLANPGKEFTVRTFITRSASYTAESFKNMADSGDTTLLWGQLCAFIKQEFSKKTEKLTDEIALLQSAGIVEYLNNYYRNQLQKDLQTETALKNLLLAFQKSPYYFTMKQITQFTDTRGIPLLGQYSEKTLQDFMKEKTAVSGEFTLPDILTFKNTSEERFYVLAEKAVPLIISLINEARKPVRDECIKRWHHILSSFYKDDSMKDEAAFSNLIRTITAEAAPNLYGLLNAPFTTALLSDSRLNEIQNLEINRIFPGGKIAPYSEILMLSRTELLSDTKILLPFWYGIPFVYSIVAFFKRPKNKQKKDNNQAKKNEQQIISRTKLTLKDAAENISAEFVPQGMTFDEALKRYLDEWNQNLNTTVRDNLTEDVNALIRDYIRSVQKTLSTVNFTVERVRGLAQTLAGTPSLLKIKNSKALTKYIELYILKVIKKYF
ncbi:hypothetical protein [Treponema pedis]|uniref:hypothetical protein n=1 Tax=Treponema pedis TaxID=409322 RepID=UPI003133FC6E